MLLLIEVHQHNDQEDDDQLTCETWVQVVVITSSQFSVTTVSSCRSTTVWQTCRCIDDHYYDEDDRGNEQLCSRDHDVDEEVEDNDDDEDEDDSRNDR